jgi:hypothetical protein
MLKSWIFMVVGFDFVKINKKSSEKWSFFSFSLFVQQKINLQSLIYLVFKNDFNSRFLRYIWIISLQKYYAFFQFNCKNKTGLSSFVILKIVDSSEKFSCITTVSFKEKVFSWNSFQNYPVFHSESIFRQHGLSTTLGILHCWHDWQYPNRTGILSSQNYLFSWLIIILEKLCVGFFW